MQAVLRMQPQPQPHPYLPDRLFYKLTVDRPVRVVFIFWLLSSKLHLT